MIVARRLIRLQTMNNVLKYRKNDKIMSKIYLQEPQRNRNAIANYVNLIRTSTVTRQTVQSLIRHRGDVRRLIWAWSFCSPICRGFPDDVTKIASFRLASYSMRSNTSKNTISHTTFLISGLEQRVEIYSSLTCKITCDFYALSWLVPLLIYW